MISSSFLKARLDPVDRLEDLRTEHVDADERQVADRFLRLLDEPDDLAVAELGDAEHLRIGHAREQDLRRRLLAGELLDEVRDALVEEVVAEVHDERIGADEWLADLHGVREAERRVLLDVLDANAPSRAVADRGSDFRLRVADDDADVADAGGGDGLDAVEEHGLVRHRDELLGAGVGQRPQARPFAAAEDEPLHVSSRLPSGRRTRRRNSRRCRGRPARTTR